MINVHFISKVAMKYSEYIIVIVFLLVRSIFKNSG